MKAPTLLDDVAQWPLMHARSKARVVNANSTYVSEVAAHGRYSNDRKEIGGYENNKRSTELSIKASIVHTRYRNDSCGVLLINLLPELTER